MKSIGIVCALEDEAKYIIDSIPMYKEIRYLSFKFFSGVVNGINITVLCSGVGGASAEIGTRILISRFSIEYLVVLGVAGAISTRVKVGDTVIPGDIFQYKLENDENSSCESHLQTLSYDNALTATARSACLTVMQQDRIVTGRIATVDKFVNCSSLKENIYNHCGADCVEMESANIGKVCMDYNVPFTVVRIISDYSDYSAAESFKSNIHNISVQFKDIAFFILSNHP